eukprot:497331_1
MRRTSLPSDISSADDAAKWKENYNNIQRVSQQQKHELSMLKIEAQSYQRRNESLLKQIGNLKQKLQQNPKSPHKVQMSSSTAATTITHDTGITSPRSTNMEQRQMRKIANLEYEVKLLKDENDKLKEDITEQRKGNIVSHSKIHVLEHEIKDLQNRNNEQSNDNNMEHNKKVLLYDIKKQIEDALKLYDSIKYRSVLTDGMKQNIADILKDTNTLCNNIENGFYVPLSQQMETAQTTMGKLRYSVSNLKTKNKDLNERNIEILTENSKLKKNMSTV